MADYSAVILLYSFLFLFRVLQALQTTRRRRADAEMLAIVNQTNTFNATCRRLRLRRYAARHLSSPSVRRSIWSVSRSKAWWNSVIRGDFGPAWWKENLRVSKATFLFICAELTPSIERKNTLYRCAITVEERVAITLWRLSTNIEYRTIAHLFGVGRSSACMIVLDTCSALQSLLPKYVYIPQGSNMRQNVDGFEDRWGFPQAAGAIDGTHIPIIRPPGESGTDYFNRKGHYSVIMQALVDYRGIFMDICIGWPGKVHDARVFANSSLHRKGEAGNLLPLWTRRIASTDVPLCILGDGAYPALPWLLKGYPEHQQLTARQKGFNYRLSRARMVVENAFGRLKGRWRCLLKRNDCWLDNVITITTACVILHNICELTRDECLQQWTVVDNQCSTSGTTPTSSSSTQSSRIRDSIAEYLENH